MKVSVDNCTGCPVFDNDKHRNNMIEYDICGRRDDTRT
jgi:hypothetical protein